MRDQTFAGHATGRYLFVNENAVDERARNTQLSAVRAHIARSRASIATGTSRTREYTRPQVREKQQGPSLSSGREAGQVESTGSPRPVPDKSHLPHVSKDHESGVDVLRSPRANPHRFPDATGTGGLLRSSAPANTLFSPFPIEHSSLTESAFNYYVYFYAPVAVRPVIDPDLYPRYFQIILSDPMCFQVFVATSLFSQAMEKRMGKDARAAALYHSRQALASLQTRINAKEDCTTDLFYMTVMQFCAMSISYLDFIAAKKHIRGLSKIVELRGGEDRLGWNGFFKMRYRQLLKCEAAIDTSDDHAEYVQDCDERRVGDVATYSLSKLPPGFSELHGVVPLEHHVVKAIITYSLVTGGGWIANVTLAAQALKLCERPQRSPKETWILLAIASLCMFYTRKLTTTVFLEVETKLEQFLQKIILKEQSVTELDDLHVWALMVLEKTSRADASTLDLVRAAYSKISEVEKTRCTEEDKFLQNPVEIV